jgi:hypothetical protein
VLSFEEFKNKFVFPPSKTFACFLCMFYSNNLSVCSASPTPFDLCRLIINDLFPYFLSLLFSFSFYIFLLFLFFLYAFNVHFLSPGITFFVKFSPFLCTFFLPTISISLVLLFLFYSIYQQTSQFYFKGSWKARSL